MKLLLAPGLAVLLAGPALAQPCRVAGTVRGIGHAPIVFWYTRQGQQHRDTVRATHDRFTYLAQPSDDGLISVFISAPRFASFWYAPGGRLTLTGNAARPSQLTVTGSPDNDAQAEYERTIEWKYQAKTDDYAAVKAQEQRIGPLTLRFIGQHPASRQSARLLYWQTVYDEHPLAEYERLLARLSPAVRQSYQGRQVARRLRVLRDQPALGRPVPAFSIADTAGVPHTLASYQGRYVLLDFWGHWCGPCIRAVPKLRALHARYGEKLAVIGIGAEAATDAAAWKQAIRQHQVPGVQLSELQAEQGPVAVRYNVTEFPTYLLLDPQGRLLARTNNVDDIARKLAALTDL